MSAARHTPGSGSRARRPGPPLPRLALACGAGALALACGVLDETPHYAPPTRPHAALLLEPPEVALGDVAEVTLVVVTPEGYVPEPVDAPASFPGFWVLETLRPDAEKTPGRWVHRTVFRVRAREVGRTAFPALPVAVAAPDGSVTPLEVEALPLEVVSALADLPDQLRPFGPRRLPRSAPSPAQSAVAFAAGAVLALAVVGLVALARRRRSTRPLCELRETPPSPWLAARSGLAAARERAAGDPLAALDTIAHVLRHYVAARFGADAVARTTEELREARPPFTLTTRWPALLDLLGRLDDLRLPPAADGSREALTASAVALTDEARAFVEESVPAEAHA